MASILAGVKQRLGIFYSDATKDAEVSGMIAGAKAFLVSGGWGPSELETDSESAEAIEAIVIYCKMAQELSTSEISVHPVLTALIGTARAREIERRGN